MTLIRWAADLGQGALGASKVKREERYEKPCHCHNFGPLGLQRDATAQSWQPPSPSERCPSKWGATDERGSGNHMTPANVLRAAHLIKTGETFELSHVLA